MNNNLVKIIYKKIGETPFEAVNRFKVENPGYSNSKVSYAGRLDPLAHGLLVLLVDDENKNRRLYENLEKDYTFKIIIGFSTDSYDILGLINNTTIKSIQTKELKRIIPKYKGKILQQLPPYSAYVVKGKPLFKWARDNDLDKIEIPQREIEIKELSYISTTYINSSKLLQIIDNRISIVNGNFRQKDIKDLWRIKLKNLNHDIQIIEMKATVSSGTYIRGLVNSFSQELNIPMCCLEIYRNRVGNYSI